MLDFISKLIRGRSDTKKNDQQVVAVLNKNLQIEEKHKSKEQERQLFMQKVDAAGDDESLLINLLTECDFADGRFHAAQKIVSQSALEQVLPAMRKLDKRVAKLFQTRLDEIADNLRNELAAQACVAAAEVLIQQNLVLSNQLVDLDKQHAQVKQFSENLQTQFQEKRQILSQRLEQQIQLQQRVLSLKQEFEQVVDQASPDLKSKLSKWQTRLDACIADDYAASLPKNLIIECQQKMHAIQDNWRKAQQVQPTPVFATVPDAALTPEAGNVEPELHAGNSKSTKKKVSKPQLALSIAQIELILQQMEIALEQGSVQNARKYERELRDVDTKQNYANLVLSVNLKERINLARKSLTHLLSWAKWSGNASRDELVTTAESLVGLKLSPKEIVETVSALREQWKQTEASSGAASKELWVRFDAACNAAYAPAAQFFSEQNEQRQANLVQAEAKLLEWRAQSQLLGLYSETHAEAADNIGDQVDWKHVFNSIQQMQSGWRAIGQVDRKDKARLDKEFDAVLAPLRQALERRQKQEVQERENLIVAASQLDGAQKSSIDQLRQLQQRWQMQAARVPLPRKEDQALWERFRSACDAVFEKKRASVESADKRRQDNLHAKQEICIALRETQLKNLSDISQIAQAIEHAKSAWRQYANVPRDQEQKIEQEFSHLLDGLQQQVIQLKAKAQQDKTQQILKKIHTCLQMELLVQGLLPQETTTVDHCKQDWLVCALPDSMISKALQQRFENVCRASEQPGNTLATSTDSSKFEEILLHLEILLGIDSPAELSLQRLQKQVDVLQSSLKNGQDAKQLTELLNQLLNMPLIGNVQMQERIEGIFAKANLMAR